MFNFFSSNNVKQALHAEKLKLQRALRAHMRSNGVNSKEVKAVEHRLDQIDQALLAA